MKNRKINKEILKGENSAQDKAQREEAKAQSAQSLKKKIIHNRPKCLGFQGCEAFCNGAIIKCCDCALFDICHKLSVSGALHEISNMTDDISLNIIHDLRLIVRNGILDGRLKNCAELAKIESGE